MDQKMASFEVTLTRWGARLELLEQQVDQLDQLVRSIAKTVGDVAVLALQSDLQSARRFLAEGRNANNEGAGSLPANETAPRSSGECSGGHFPQTEEDGA